jgi:hypothetical protein
MSQYLDNVLTDGVKVQPYALTGKPLLSDRLLTLNSGGGCVDLRPPSKS